MYITCKYTHNINSITALLRFVPVKTLSWFFINFSSKAVPENFTKMNYLSPKTSSLSILQNKVFIALQVVTERVATTETQRSIILPRALHQPQLGLWSGCPIGWKYIIYIFTINYT